MSEIAINTYLKELEKLKHYGGSANETAIRSAFQNLLTTYARARGLVLVPEIRIQGSKGKPVVPDGTLKDDLRLDWGYWESKDQFDDLDLEIQKKFEKGYPRDNILFEDSSTAVLIQNGIEVQRADVGDPPALDSLLKNFVNYELPDVRAFRKAIELFKEDIPKVTSALRESIIKNAENNPAYKKARDEFLQLCREVINPVITPEDIREMVIQHIMTEDIFNTIFDDPYFHQDNNIARELEKLTDTFFTRAVRQKTLARIKHYYGAINAQAARISDHHEKQRFLKVVYETFYKSYSPKKADRLGVVYTPNEIVRFMVRSTDYLLQKHFGKMLQDPEVEILDPATGTGTFICDIIDHIRQDKLEYKYKNELHANEVEILPYYIANLNIEFTYKQKTGRYCEFENLCFVDTLDNYVNLNKGAQQDIFSITDENAERIKRQNERKISVIIGNPPYNANQMNENENNKNREYPEIDKRIKETFIKHSTAQKTKTYDMYSRFYRWAMDRLDNNGVIAFITNRSFIESRTFDGFRKVLMDEFDYAYIIDTKSDVRQNPKIAGTTHNVFGIQTGVAVMLLIKKQDRDNAQCRISYFAMQDNWLREDKLLWFCENNIPSIEFTTIEPDKDHNWINLVENDWDEMIPIADKQVKTGKKKDGVIFDLYSLGVVSNRDEWTYDFDLDNLKNKINMMMKVYNRSLDTKKMDDTIKWTRDLKKRFARGDSISVVDISFTQSSFRPYVSQYYYFDRAINEMLYQMPVIFPNNIVISCKGEGMAHPFHCLTTDKIPHLQYTPNGQCFPKYRYDSDGHRHDNITDWALREFRSHYRDENINKNDIFHYVYGVLHDPAYRKKYEINLKRSLPRVPFKEDFWSWANWGGELMDLHLGFETAEPWPLELRSLEPEEGILPKAKLKADKAGGIIILDDHTSLHGIPEIAWEYKLGNRSALEWILDQYKEKKPRDPTIARLFNTYRFADYKEKVIDLLTRVCTVSVKTMEIIVKMTEPEVFPKI